MEALDSKVGLIAKELENKGNLKQAVYRNTKEQFKQLKKVAKKIVEELNDLTEDRLDSNIEILFIDKGDYEARIKFAGDVLVIYMHTNVFEFERSHSMYSTSYIKEDEQRSFCGMINFYNFLADSFKYDRFNDSGYLIARIFVNKDNHFFVEGKRQLGFLFNDFSNSKISATSLRSIIETAILYAMEFDLYTPPYNEVKEISIGSMIHESSILKVKTSKRMGYKFSQEEDE
ncbi:hypothetical protein [Acidiluteibacter ferrifornacis]|uniref:Uncharacterized protein n=1 Tax=Acidiluteibacter ferrifornacis TaxID=2692424 RepID=A0A6N9NJ30_9FLAO|nr:hypothetical protein [Acidiluteibacter ferrifornacis]NBG66688.1 hypothetical protein [Acidiluteibacter ferrifornacis]